MAEDLRRYGLVLLGAGAIADVTATFRVLAFAAGLIFLMIAYIILTVSGGDE